MSEDQSPSCSSVSLVLQTFKKCLTHHIYHVKQSVELIQSEVRGIRFQVWAHHGCYTFPVPKSTCSNRNFTLKPQGEHNVSAHGEAVCFQAEQEKLVTRHGVLQKGMLMQLDSCDHLCVVCALPLGTGALFGQDWIFPAFFMWRCIDIDQQRNKKIAEEKKLKN